VSSLFPAPIPLDGRTGGGGAVFVFWPAEGDQLSSLGGGGGLGKKGPGAAANGLNSSHYNGSPALSTRIFRVGARSSAHTDPNASYLLTPSAGDPKGGRGPSGDPRRGGAAGGVPPRDRQ